MCGIVGILGRPLIKPTDAITALEEALFCDTLRGSDGTGIMAIHGHTGKVFTAKRGLHAPDFLETRAYRKIKSRFHNSKFIVGHNRWGTIGNTSDETSHPFSHGPITLVHNGSLATTWRGNLDVVKQKFEIDSEGIAYALSQVKPNQAPKVLSKIRGSFALVWYDSRTEQLRFVRNEQRPLAFLPGKEKKWWMFGSELPMLEWIAWRNGLDMEDGFEFKDSVICNVGLKDLSFSHNKVKLLEKEVYTPTRYPANNTGAWDQDINIRLAGFSLKIGDKIKFKWIPPGHNPHEHSRSTIDVYGDPIAGLRTFIVYARSVPKATMTSNTDTFEGEVISVRSGNSVHNYKTEVILKDIKAVVNISKETKEEDEDDDTPSTKKEDNVLFLPLPLDGEVVFDGPNDTSVSEKEMLALTRDGCGGCGDPIAKDEYSELRWIDTHPVCIGCQGDDLLCHMLGGPLQ
jgi:predicted glutamine amidotransferase